MNLSEIKDQCKKGKIGLIPGWKGYLKWNIVKNQIYFVNNDYIMDQKQLEDIIKDRNDLYYII